MGDGGGEGRAGSVAFVGAFTRPPRAPHQSARQGEFSFVVSGSATACWSGVCFFVFFCGRYIAPGQVFCGRSTSTYSTGRSPLGIRP